jgi:hypothetical protein
MALPRLTIKLFPIREPSGDLERSGSLQIPLADVHALCEWLLSQPGSYDAYLQTEVVSLAALQYSNRSRNGAAYLSVQLREPRPRHSKPAPADGQQPPQGLTAGWQGSGAAGGSWDSGELDHGEMPF